MAKAGFGDIPSKTIGQGGFGRICALVCAFLLGLKSAFSAPVVPLSELLGVDLEKMLKPALTYSIPPPTAGSNGSRAGCNIPIVLASRARTIFGAIGFASAVSMLPGIFRFPMGGDSVDNAQPGAASSSALVEDSVVNTTTAILVVLGMTLGLVCRRASKTLRGAEARVPRRPRAF